MTGKPNVREHAYLVLVVTRGLCNALVLLVQGAQADLTDVESAFRMDRLCVENLHLFTSFIKGSWFVNLFHPFEFVPSGWGFGTVTAVLSWCLSLPKRGSSLIEMTVSFFLRRQSRPLL